MSKKIVRVTRTASVTYDLVVDADKPGGQNTFYGYDSIEELVESEKGFEGEDFWNAMVIAIEEEGLDPTTTKVTVEVVDG